MFRTFTRLGILVGVLSQMGCQSEVTTDRSEVLDPRSATQALSNPCNEDCLCECPMGTEVKCVEEGVNFVGDDGAECIIGTEEDDRIRAKQGDDYVCGCGGDDVINGGKGNDILLGGNGDDSLSDIYGTNVKCDECIDVDGECVECPACVNDDQCEPLDGVARACVNNECVLKANRCFDMGDYKDNPEDYVPALCAASKDVYCCPAAANLILGTDGPDTLTGTDDGDCMVGCDGDDTIRGKKGDDIIYGGNGDDTINGGNGDDVLRGERGKDTLTCGAGTDVAHCGAGNDSLGDPLGCETVHSSCEGAPECVQDGDCTDDNTTDCQVPVCLNGICEQENRSDWSSCVAEGEDGHCVEGLCRLPADICLFSNTDYNSRPQEFTIETCDNAVTYCCPVGFNVIIGDSEANVLNGTDRTQDCILGCGGDDTIKGGKLDDVIYGGPGDDELRGGAGDDRINGEAGDDTINGGNGDDLILGATGNDTIDCGAGADQALCSVGVDDVADESCEQQFSCENNAPGNYCDIFNTPVNGPDRENDFVEKTNWVRDTRTGLLWTSQNHPQENFQDAVEYCEGLPDVQGISWRLPDFYEIASLMTFDSSEAFTVFPDLPEGIFWTSTEHVNYSGKVWVGNFESGGLMTRTLEREDCCENSQGDCQCTPHMEPRFLYTICVNGEPTCSLMDDRWDYIRNSSGNMVRDKITALVWQANPQNPKMNWAEALDYCDDLSFGTMTDWRLPNVNELANLFEVKENYGYRFRVYWTSTEYAPDTSRAWGVSRDTTPGENLDAAVVYYRKIYDRDVICVRN